MTTHALHTTADIPLGYEVGSGAPVTIPLRHLAVTGQTQESGKTTTLEALIDRAEGLRAIAFVTKRGERSFSSGRRIPPYFRERADWQFVASVLEAIMRERLKFERAWIMRASKGARTLADVQANIHRLMEKARGMSADMYLQLDEYLKIVIPQIERLPYTRELEIQPGLNIMDLGAYTMELQALVIRSVLEWVYEREDGVVVVIPEAWEFIPQRRGSPVKLAAEELIRKGAGLHNYLWLDSQDLAGVDATIRKSVIVWLLGVQREANEVKRTLAHIPSMPKPTVAQVMQLGKGQFYACWGTTVQHVYVQPAWMDAEDAVAIARGKSTVDAMTRLYHAGAQAAGIEEESMSAEERAAYEERIKALDARVAELTEIADRWHRALDEVNPKIEELKRQLRSETELNQAAASLQRALRTFIGTGATTVGPDRKGPALDLDDLVAQVAKRIGTVGGAPVLMVAPVEALRKEFQTKEVERIVGFLRALDPRPRDALLLLETSGQLVPQKKLAERLGIPTAGESWVKFTTGMRGLAEAGMVESVERHGMKGVLRRKLADDLAVYQASPEELEQVYQACLAALVQESPRGVG